MERKNKVLLAIAIAAIAVIILGTVSYTFLAAQQKTKEPKYQTTGSSGAVGPAGTVGATAAYTATGPTPALPAITIASDGTVNSTDLNCTGAVYRLTCDVVNRDIVIGKDNIALNGSGFELVDSEITISRENVTIENMEFTNQSSINLNNASHCLITQNYVLATPNTINGWLNLQNADNNVISDNNITMGNIALMFSSNNLLTGNNITDVESSGISIEWGTNNKVSNNYFEKVLTPVEDDYNGNIVCNNNMVNCDEGVRILGSANIVFGNNMTYFDLGYHAGLQTGDNWMTGIAILGSNNTVYRNTIAGYAFAGISINPSSSWKLSNGTPNPGEGVDNSIFENIITDNNNGVILEYFTYSGAIVNDNTMYLNDFIDNNHSAVVCFQQQSLASTSSLSLYANYWDNGSVGNYWSDYTQKYPDAIEINNSGIMNTPYVIEAANTDLFPLSQPYQQTPVN